MGSPAKFCHVETLTADAANIVVKADPTKTRTSIWFIHEHATATVHFVNKLGDTEGFPLPKNTVFNPKWIEERDALFEEWRIYCDTAGAKLYVKEFYASKPLGD